MGFLSGLFGGETKSTKTPFEASPWKPQQDYLKSGFEGAQSELEKALKGISGMGDMTANMNPGQKADLRAGSALGRGFSGDSQGVMADLLARLQGGPQTAGMGSLGTFGANASTMFGASDPTVGNTAGQAQDIAGQLARYSSGINPTSQSQGVFGDVSQNKLGAITSGAQGMAEDPYIQAQIDSSIKDINKGFLQDRGGLNAAASGTGNINSTRAGVLEARMADDAMDRAGQVSTSIRSNAYNKGLDVAQQAEAMRQGNMLGANGQIQQDDSLRLGAAGLDLQGRTAGLSGILNAGQLQLGDRSEANGTKLNANAQVGDAAQIADNLATGASNRYNTTFGQYGSSYDMAAGGLQDSLNANTQYQTQEQNEIAGELQKLGMPMEFITQYMAAIGGNYGQQGYQTQVTEKPGLLQTLTGAASALSGAGGLFK